MISMVFFFQAEDGIRDYKVTGVQTCALPIYFNEVLESIDPSTIFIECYLPSNQELSKDFSNFFQKNNINSQKISEFLRTIIEKDSQELISTPFKHISATDIRSLHKFTPPSFI